MPGGGKLDEGRALGEGVGLYARVDQGSRGDHCGAAQTQQAMGRYAESVDTLRAALAIAERSGTRRGSPRRWRVGNAYVALGSEAAESF
jgi:hypothetical protein